MDKARSGYIVSIGGNAIIRRGEAGTVEEQFRNARAAASGVARLAASGERVLVTHGNGPVVGNIMLAAEAASRAGAPLTPLYMADADSEGGMGFMLQQLIHNRLRSLKCAADAVTVVTQVVVDAADPAFGYPSKPIGPFYTVDEAARLSRERGWAMAEDSARGFRRVVASPRPLRIVELNAVKTLFSSGVIVIAAGGGGVPVVEGEDGSLKGVDAVVDKDLATSLLAGLVGAARFVNLTQTDAAYLGYARPGQKRIESMTAGEARKYLAAGEFAPGSMGPKVEAAIEFIEGGGKDAYITSPELMDEALEGRAGTRIAAS